MKKSYFFTFTSFSFCCNVFLQFFFVCSLFFYQIFCQSSPVFAQKTLQVYVKDLQNQPVRNLKIIINGKQSITTGSQGENSIKIFREGKIQTVRLENPDWILSDWQYTPQGKLFVTLEKSFLLKGRLVTAQNIPVPEAYIWLTGIRGMSPILTNENGVFTISLPKNLEKTIKNAQENIAQETLNNNPIFLEKILIYDQKKLGGLATALIKNKNNTKKNDTITTFILSEIILKSPENQVNTTAEIDQNLLSLEEKKQMMLVEKQYLVLEKQNLEKQRDILLERLKRQIPQQTKELMEIELEKINKKLANNKKDFVVTQEKTDNAIQELMEIVSESEKNHEKTQAELSETKNQKDTAETANEVAQRTLTFGAIGVGFLLIFVLILAFTLRKIRNQRQKLEEQVEEINMTNAILKKSSDILDKKTQEIFAQKDELEKSNEKIMDSMRYALSIQQAILPKRTLIQQHVKDDMLWYEPRDIVSGDFYWFSQVDNYLFFAVADCTGHGVPGAFMTVMANTLLNQIVNENNETQPKTILSLLHHKIQTNLNAQSNRDGDGLDIGLLRIDTQNQKAIFAGAKVPLYCFLDNHCITFKATNFSIGSTLRAEKPVDEHEISLTGNEIFYLMTDGWQDQLGGNALPRRKFMKNKVMELLATYHQLPFSQQIDIFAKEFRNWKIYNDQTDDLLLWGIILKPTNG